VFVNFSPPLKRIEVCWPHQGRGFDLRLAAQFVLGTQGRFGPSFPGVNPARERMAKGLFFFFFFRREGVVYILRNLTRPKNIRLFSVATKSHKGERKYKRRFGKIIVKRFVFLTQKIPEPARVFIFCATG